MFLGDSFGATVNAVVIASIAGEASTASFCWTGAFSTVCADAGEPSFLFDFDPPAKKNFLILFRFIDFNGKRIPFLLSFLLMRPSDSSRCFFISKSSFGWLLSKWFNDSIEPLVGGAGFGAVVGLFTRMPLPGDFVVLVLRTIGNFPADSWRWILKKIQFVKKKSSLLPN